MLHRKLPCCQVMDSRQSPTPCLIIQELWTVHITGLTAICFSTVNSIWTTQVMHNFWGYTPPVQRSDGMFWNFSLAVDRSFISLLLLLCSKSVSQVSERAFPIPSWNTRSRKPTFTQPNSAPVSSHFSYVPSNKPISVRSMSLRNVEVDREGRVWSFVDDKGEVGCESLSESITGSVSSSARVGDCALLGSLELSLCGDIVWASCNIMIVQATQETSGCNSTRQLEQELSILVLLMTQSCSSSLKCLSFPGPTNY